MRRLAALAIAAGCLALPMRARACAGCSNPNLPAGGPAPSYVARGPWHASVALTGVRLRVVHESRCPDIGPVCRERDEPPDMHDKLIRISELRPVVEYGLTDRVGLRLQAPFKRIHTAITYRRLDGTAFVPDWEGIHHRAETLAGLTDPWLTARLSGSLGGWDLAGRFGLSIPLRRTEPNPFNAGLEGRAQQQLHFGTGTVNPVLAARPRDASAPCSRAGTCRR